MPAVAYLLPTYLVPTAMASERISNFAIATLLALLALLAMLVAVFKLMKLMGAQRFQSLFNFRVVNSAPLGILIL